MDIQEKTFKNPIEEQRKAALEHYEQVSRAANHWSSFVESAIKAYSPESCPPPVSAEVVSHNEWFNSQSDVRQLLLLHPDGEMIERSCLHFLGDDAQAWWVNRKSSPSAPVVAEQVAQWAVNNRYPKSEFDKVSDHEFYHTLLDKINSLHSPAERIEGDAVDCVYEIDFGGNLKCRMKIVGNKINVEAAMNGWGDGISIDEIKITELKTPHHE